jgi:hypothetical protein
MEKNSVFILISGMSLVLLAGGCGLGNMKPVAESELGGIVPLTRSPVGLDSIASTTPLGNLNPPGHTLPTDHIYFYRAKARSCTVYAPLGGSIDEVYFGKLPKKHFLK